MSLTVAGGGLAGAAAAIRLARAGRPVTLYERTIGPTHKVCGEFLSHEAATDLASLGLDLHALSPQRITHLRLIRGSRHTRVELPFQALGLTRYRLDEALLTLAAQTGVNVCRGEIFRFGQRLAGTLFLATGKHETRGLPRPARDDGLLGFKTYFDLSPGQQNAVRGHVELYLFPDGYAGLQLVDDGAANLCLLTSGARFSRVGTWANLLASLAEESPLLASRLNNATDRLDRPLAIARTPFGFVHRPSPSDPDGVFRLGDQSAVIPAFAGDGMAVALHSAALAASTHIGGGSAATYHRRLHRDVAAQIRRASFIYRAGCHPAGQRAFMALAKTVPSAIRLAAAFTRVRG